LQVSNPSSIRTVMSDLIMKLIFLYGLPATGKLTVGKELAAITGYKLFHNHLTVDLLLSVFEFGSPQFVELREKIWLSVFESAISAGLPGLIFTFAPETTVHPEFVDNAVQAIQRQANAAHRDILFVELTCPLTNLKSRIESPSRAQYQKLASISLFERLHGAGVFDSSHMPQPALSVDTSLVTPAEAAATIAKKLNLT
jgi:hypothetical protein